MFEMKVIATVVFETRMKIFREALERDLQIITARVNDGIDRTDAGWIDPSVIEDLAENRAVTWELRRRQHVAFRVLKGLSLDTLRVLWNNPRTFKITYGEEDQSGTRPVVPAPEAFRAFLWGLGTHAEAIAQIERENALSTSADDLTQIASLDSRHQAKLNARLGVYTFEQMAAWNEEDIGRVVRFVEVGAIMCGIWQSDAQEFTSLKGQAIRA